MNRPLTDSIQQRAVSSAVGYLLVLGITIATAVGIVVGGGAIIDGAQGDSQTSQAEQALTQLDSKAAQVALGDSERKRISLGGARGAYSVDEDAGEIRIYHEDWDEEEAVDDEIIYGPKDLGAITYRSGDTQIAYQGGGVWRTDGDGSSTMISPPEFHYRGATLTFPLIRVTGSGSASGDARARIVKGETAKSIYPDLGEESTALENQYDEDRSYANPVQHGNMTVEIQSQYCEGWRGYLEQRTDGEVSECGQDNRVTAQLITLGTQGDFSITSGSELNIRGLEDGDDMRSFELEFGSDSSADFNNFRWSAHGETDSGDKQFELYIENTGGGQNCDTEVRVIYYYSDDGGDTYQTWVNDDEHGSNPFKIECDEDDNEVLVVDLLDADRDMKYIDTADIGNDDLLGFDYEGDFTTDEPLATSQEPIEEVTRHYFGLTGDIELNIEEDAKGEGTGLSEDQSSGNINYEGSGRVVTFLHITENEIEVELE